ncbi:flagellar motor switch protein FliG [Candidatus Liberibacter asiaticus]|uniref:Flagellar motor switch protein FliG n=3 Tax=Liberibacter asiaticus TaxID=34021 RepID=C6XFK9_LIBAP|nr:flagellar motor switch protein FliG [Candidatus Liberibacter asiaticus]ACT57162.1 flagellar motor switch protein G [Candidatus Liberibacter asiaticus str. psy62]AGH16875.1 flagellar motor switch protein G [Candidatus Liberibacter asiaticus str. gxpsy]ALK07778.1 flagellar motor switch protein FliG [Candidatus Liberibacter asiaticus]ASK52713.1 flagellar motor switch protein FliG [Candidatus Liberibacter asiaticus]AWL14555.1 flagellar motor switch protein FliG [Candidatus Liberibacter asiaticu
MNKTTDTVSFKNLYKEISPVSLTQKDKATAILLAMEKQVSGKLLRHFTHAELKEIVASAKLLPEISPEELEDIIDEFESQFIAGIGLTENSKNIESILEEGLEQNELEKLLNKSDISQENNNSIWDHLKETDPGVIADFLSKEHPQTTAYVLSMMPPSIGASVLLRFPNKIHADIMKRTVNLPKISPYIQKTIEKCIVEMLPQSNSNTSTGPEKVANLINELEKPQVDKLLTSLQEVSKEAFDKVRPKVFLFDDLITLSSHDLSIVFNNISLEVLGKALHGTSIETQNAILHCLSNRQRKIIEENIVLNDSSIAPREVAMARRSIVQEAISLLKTNKIELSNPIK